MRCHFLKAVSAVHDHHITVGQTSQAGHGNSRRTSSSGAEKLPFAQIVFVKPRVLKFFYRDSSRSAKILYDFFKLGIALCRSRVSDVYRMARPLRDPSQFAPALITEPTRVITSLGSLPRSFIDCKKTGCLLVAEFKG